jgi:AraC-like DNA-binding protein
MDIIVIIAISQATLLGLLLLLKKNRRLSDRMLSGYFAATAITLLLAWLEMYNREHGYPFPFLINLSTPFIFLAGPALWFYIKSLTNKDFRFSIWHLFHFLPFVLVFLILYVENYSLSAEQRIAFETSNALLQTWIFPLIVTMIVFSTQGYYVWGLFILHDYRKKIKTYFAKLDNINLGWLKFLLICSIVFHASISALYALNIFFVFASYGNLQLFGYLIAALFVIVIGFFGLQQGDIFSSVPEKFSFEKASEIETIPSKLTNTEEAFVYKLLQYMKEHKPFLDSELTLGTLSAFMDVSPEYLSGILNNRLNKNFFDFVNHFRIEEFKKLSSLPENQKLTLIALAYDCGFSSKATFNRVFKNITGTTPSQYLQEVSKK